MISNHILQTSVDGLKKITGKEMAVLEPGGNITVQTAHFDKNRPFSLFGDGMTDYGVAVQGDDESASQTGKFAAFHVQSLVIAYKERFDRDNFIKNLLLDNLLLADICNRAKKLHVENNVRRVVYLIETEMDKDMNALEIVRNIFPAKQRDFVTAVDECSIILVKELREKENEIEQYARDICDTLSSEAMSNVFVAIGTVVTDLQHVSTSYKDACMARDVGKIFEADKQIVDYQQLGIGRLIYQLPIPLCRVFIDEVLHSHPVSSFDDVTLNTVQKLFENDLNVSETSRALYIHRNTLVYRLDKLQKQTGLDLRRFDDAITFKITLMVSKYMQQKGII